MTQQHGGYNLLSKGCGMMFFAALTILFGMSVGAPVAFAFMLSR